MNKVFLIGRLTKDPELKFTNGSGIAVATFSLAVDRNFKKEDDTKDADFINIVCWRKLAELVANNLSKGRLVAISGAIQTRNYTPTDGGKKVYITEIVADEVKFLDWPKDGSSNNIQTNSGSSSNTERGYPYEEGFYPVDDDDIPF